MSPPRSPTSRNSLDGLSAPPGGAAASPRGGPSASHLAVIATARQCLNTPFKHQGRIPCRGLDCAGLGIVVAREIGADFIDGANYGRSPAGGLFEAMLDAQPCLERVPFVADRQPGDLLLMRFTGQPQHLAIMSDTGTIIHALAKAGKVCEHRLDIQWSRRIARVYRFKNVGEESGVRSEELTAKADPGAVFSSSLLTPPSSLGKAP